jgi:multimeric flavodoxin WrbA
MKITAFNGSPNGESGNTNVMVTAFLKGAEASGAEVENIFLVNKEINHCKGCYSCLFSGQGKCSIEDDMKDLMSKFIESDIVVFATPLYVHNVSGMLKVFMDRSLCIGSPGYEKDENGEYRGRKSKRYRNGIPPKIVVISSCGRPDRSNFQFISLLMKKVAKDHYTELVAEIYATEGMLLTAGIKELEPIINGYKELLYKAGQEIVINMKLSGETQKLLEKNFRPTDIYVQGLNKLADVPFGKF